MTGEEIFKLAVGVMGWDPEYILDDMSIDILALALEGKLEAVDPERAKRIKDHREPDENFALQLIDILKKQEHGSATK